MGTLDRTILTTSFLSRIGSWLPRGWHWRRSSLGPLQTLLTVMHMIALGSKGYRAALRDVFADMHRAFGWGDGAPTPSALTQARGKLSEKMCRDLFHRVMAAAVTSIDEALQSWHVSIRYLWQNRARRRPGRSARRTSQRPHSIKFRDEISSAAAKGGRKKNGVERC